MTQNTATSDLSLVADSFKMHLEGMFNQWEAAKPLRTGAPHASAILQSESDWCVRRQVLLRLYPGEARHPERQAWDGHQNMVFLHGWHLHEKYQKLFQDYAEVIEVEQSHYDETREVYFTPDAILRYIGYPHVVEIKGYKNETWEALNERGNPPQAAWHQCNLYCHLLKIQHGIVLVENKDTQHVKIWMIEHDAELARPYTDRMYAVKGGCLKAAGGRGLPERACERRTERRACKCPVRDVCFSGKLEAN